MFFKFYIKISLQQRLTVLSKVHKIKGLDGPITLKRGPNGFPIAHTHSWLDAFYALGWLHARDRGGQLQLLRTLAQGRLCELMRDNESLFEVDCYFRRLGFAYDAQQYYPQIKDPYTSYLEAYSCGINKSWQQHYPRLLTWLFGTPETFEPHQILALLKLTSYAGLAESQRINELLIMEMVQRGLPENALRALFPQIGEIDYTKIQQLNYLPPLFPTYKPQLGIGMAGGSNAWVVSGQHTASGKPLLANDPHLEINRLPAVIYEAQLQVGDFWVKGASLPGMPGFISGRNPQLAWGVTYSCADTADFFIETCRNKQFLYGDRWFDFAQRTETIKRKRKPAATIDIYQNHHGTLQSDPRQDGLHLAWRWTGQGAGGTKSMPGFIDLMTCTHVNRAQKIMRNIDAPTLHMVFADTDNNIGYQLTGALPKRGSKESGLAPIPGHRPDRDWQGIIPSTDLPQLINPASGQIVITNDQTSFHSDKTFATCCLPDYRRERITELLKNRSELVAADFMRMQYDVYSKQAERFMDFYCAQSEQPSQDFLRWDLSYTPEAITASAFSKLHKAVISELLASRLDRHWVKYLSQHTGIFSALGKYLDDLVMKDSAWLSKDSKQQIIRDLISKQKPEINKPWGHTNSITLNNLIFSSKLFSWLGFSRGPIPLAGASASIHQGTQFVAGDRRTSFAPCYHFIADLAEDCAWSNYPGGVSERPYSGLYASDLQNWSNGNYKKI